MFGKSTTGRDGRLFFRWCGFEEGGNMKRVLKIIYKSPGVKCEEVRWRSSRRCLIIKVSNRSEIV